MLPEGYELFSEARCNIPWEIAREVYADRVHDWRHPSELMPEWVYREVHAGAAQLGEATAPGVLDVGGGKGVVGADWFLAKQIPVTILDAWWPPGVAQPPGLILGDAREVIQLVGGRRWFWVQATEILEHMPKVPDGRKFLEDLKEVTAGVLCISTPYCYLHQPVQEDGNPYQVHVSGWLPQELEAHGFELYFNASQMFGFWTRGASVPT
jgi:hypothetical protein